MTKLFGFVYAYVRSHPLELKIKTNIKDITG